MWLRHHWNRKVVKSGIVRLTIQHFTTVEENVIDEYSICYPIYDIYYTLPVNAINICYVNTSESKNKINNIHMSCHQDACGSFPDTASFCPLKFKIFFPLELNLLK